MAPNLNREQETIAEALIRIGRRRGVGRKIINSALATGLVESNLTNIQGGDADSSGWRQERASLYPNPNNLRASINRYYDEALKFNRPGLSPGELAANVQRPAAQYRGRYGERMSEAKAIRRALAGQGGGNSRGGMRQVNAAGQTVTLPGSSGVPNLPQGASLAPLLAALQQGGQQGPSTSGPQLPGFAQGGLGQGGQVVQSSGAPVARGGSNIAEMLAQLGSSPVDTSKPGSSDISVTIPGGKGQAAGAAPGNGRGPLNGGTGLGAKPQVVFAPGANRAGVGTTPLLNKALQRLSSVTGKKITVGTGTNHSQMTTSGNVSDHWSGNGADIPLEGNQLTKRGRQALVTFGMSPAAAKKAKGGIYNLNYKGHRYQVIFNTTEGGNHWNHLHIGVR